MHENDRYIPPSQGGPNLFPDERPPQLGKISLLTIILSFLLGGLVRQLRKDEGPSVLLDAMMAAGVLIGLIMAIVALATRRGRRGVLAPALSTLVLGGLVIWLGVTNFMRAREQALQARAQGKYRLSEEQLKAIEAEVSSRESSQRTSRPSPEAAPQAPAATDPRTIQNEINQALVLYTQEQMSAWSKCVQANRELRAAGEFTPAAFMTKENIEKRRAILVRIVEATQEWENLQVTAEQKVTAALNRPSIPPEAARRHLAEWRKDRELEIPVLMQLRTAERNGSRALIGLLSILEHDLGRWELSPDKKNAVFQRPGAAEEYRELLDEARAARQEQNQLSAQFAALLKSKEAPVPVASSSPFSASSAGRAPVAPAASASSPAAPAPTGRDQWVANIAKATGAEGELFRVAKPYLEGIFEQNEACVAASKVLHAAGVLNPRELGTKAAIGERRTLVQRVIATAEQWEAAAFNADQSLPAAVQRPGIPSDKAQVFLSRWRDARYQPLLLIKRERASERLAARSMLGILALLERELGHWEASPDGKQLTFKNPGCSDELRKLVQEFNTQNTARQEASRQVQAFSPAK